jgi:Fe-S-cluster containining protein
MQFEFEPFFRRYEVLAAATDDVFRKVKERFPDLVTCRVGCTECCYALFDLSLIEAMYIHFRFNETLDETRRSNVLEKADTADRQIHIIKRKAYKAFESGKSEDEILEEMAQEKVRCPLLNETDRCDLYAFRPITCRLYGIPTEIGGVGRTCGKSGFVKGSAYPTVHLDKIHRRLYELSTELAIALKSGYTKLGEMLIPLSMALLTEFDEEYLGIPGSEKPEKEKDR